VRRAQFLWWLSIGDCVAYLFHPELARLGQFALNQRQYFEWIGRVNTFELPVPCYTTGVRELRGGRNVLLLATDGLLECGTRPFEEPRTLYRTFFAQPGAIPDLAARVAALLGRVHRERGRDSATVIAWVCENPHAVAMPSA
jgi:serine/threonine protein phosphatase PrpC